LVCLLDLFVLIVIMIVDCRLKIRNIYIVYLRTDPEVALDRLRKRGRSEECGVSVDYLRAVHTLHEEWLIEKKNGLPCPVLTINANTELDDMTPNYSLCEKTIFNYSSANVAVAN